jgi:hypothetical protein
MIDQLIKKGHCSTSAHEIIGFCILRMLDESAFGIKFTPEQNDKLLQIFTIEQMLQINDKLHDIGARDYRPFYNVSYVINYYILFDTTIAIWNLYIRVIHT